MSPILNWYENWIGTNNLSAGSGSTRENWSGADVGANPDADATPATAMTASGSEVLEIVLPGSAAHYIREDFTAESFFAYAVPIVITSEGLTVDGHSASMLSIFDGALAVVQLWQVSQQSGNLVLRATSYHNNGTATTVNSATITTGTKILLEGKWDDVANVSSMWHDNTALHNDAAFVDSGSLPGSVGVLVQGDTSAGLQAVTFQAGRVVCSFSSRVNKAPDSQSRISRSRRSPIRAGRIAA